MIQPSLLTAELLKAVIARDINLAMIYLEQGADPNGANPETGGSFLHHAVEFERSGELAKLLIEYGADVNAANPRYGTTAAMYAARSNMPALTLLLEKGVDLDKKDGVDRTALDWARQTENTKAVKMIKKALGQQVQQAEQARLSALHDTAAKRQNILKNLRPKMARPQ